jgi:hypothetical protein
MGVSLLQHCFFVHVESDEEKFRVLMEMLHKLYALVNLQCCEDNPDALTHHEVLLPGQLLIKFFKEKCEDVLTAFSEQVHSAGGCNVVKCCFCPECGTIACASVMMLWGENLRGCGEEGGLGKTHHTV